MWRYTLFALAITAGLASPAAADGSIELKGAWARATPQGAATGAAYVTVMNNGTAADRLVSASTPVAGQAQIHTTISDNGVMKMRPVAAIEVKPGAAIELKPGGFHVMLMQLKAPLKEGQTFPLTLTFANAGKIETTVTVAKAGAMSGMDMGGHTMPGMNMGK